MTTVTVDEQRNTVTINGDDVTVATVGTQGPEGVGVATGGSTGQHLAKVSGTNFDTEWTNNLQRPSVLMTVTNSTGSGMVKGDLVYVSGTDAGVPTVALADADDASTASGMLLLVVESIAAAASGRALVFGYVSGLAGLVAGTTYYVSTSAGDITATAPIGPGDIVRVTGYALSGTEFFFLPDGTWVQLTT
jgi:hypothetical protein